MRRHKRIAPKSRREAPADVLDRLAHSLAKLLRAAYHAPAAKLQPVKVSDTSDSYWRRYY
jgi:hypothetical protein